MRGSKSRRVLIAFLLAAALTPTPGCVSDKSQPGAAPEMVLLVRHAEKAKEPAEDPPLTPTGAQRAQDLAAALKDAGVTAIITTQLRRTRETAQPLADAQGLSPEIVPVGEDEDAHAAAVAAAVRGHPGGIVLVVGHSNTVPKIIAALGGPSMPEICEALFANLFVLALDADAARLVRAHYGAADDPPAADCE